MLRFNCTDVSFDANAKTVSLCSSVDYIKSNKVLDALGVGLHSHLKILICYSCRVALTSGMVVGHRRNHHHSYQVCAKCSIFICTRR
jgi:RNase P subunit RPR2